MPETFEYSSSKRTIRKKTFSSAQKLVLSSLWIPVSIISVGGIVLQNNGALPAGLLVLLLLIFAPLFLALVCFALMAVNPKGPEMDFELPTMESDPTDRSVVRGSITTIENQIHDVEVKVPNVYGTESDILGDAIPGEGSVRLAHEEMFELALALVQARYPGCTWSGSPFVE